MNRPIIDLYRATPRLARTCLHESAHAVVGTVLGCPVDLLSAVPAGASRGRCIFALETLQKGTARAAAFLAGPMAVRILEDEGLRAPAVDSSPAWLTDARPSDPGPPPPGLTYTEQDDDAGANTAVRSPEGLQWARTMALTVLATRWDTVVALAEELARAGHLDGDQVRRIITGSQGATASGDLRARARRAAPRTPRREPGRASGLGALSSAGRARVRGSRASR